MAFGNEKTIYTGSRSIDQAEFDVGLRAHMLRVYNYMASGLALTGIFAIVISQMSFITNDAGQLVAYTSLGQTLFGTPLKWVVMLAPLGLVFFLSARIHALKQSTAQMVFWLYAALMGVSFAVILIQFTGASVARENNVPKGLSYPFFTRAGGQDDGSLPNSLKLSHTR